MQRIGSSLLLNVGVMGLAVACYGMAVFFHYQYVHAHGVVAEAMRQGGGGGGLSVGLPRPEIYFTRAEAMFYLGLVIWVFATVFAVGTKRWYSWLALLVVTGFIFAIPISVLSRV